MDELDELTFYGIAPAEVDENGEYPAATDQYELSKLLQRATIELCGMDTSNLGWQQREALGHAMMAILATQEVATNSDTTLGDRHDIDDEMKESN